MNPSRHIGPSKANWKIPKPAVTAAAIHVAMVNTRNRLDTLSA